MQLYPLTRVYSDADGHSRFEDVSVPMNEAGDIGWLSDGLPVKSIIFREVEPSYDYDFHNAPQRQYLVLIDGEIEIETSLGETRRFKGGDVLLLEDTGGKGHRTKNIVPMRRKSLFITL